MQELSTLLGIAVSEDISDKEALLKQKIKQEISQLYLNQRTLQRKIDNLEKKALLYGI